MRRAIVAAALAAALTAIIGVSLAEAAPPRSNAQVARLTKEVKSLQHRLQNMTLSCDEAKTALSQEQAANATLRSANATLQGANGTLQGQVTQLTRARDAALAQVASLRAQLAAIPTPLAVAVEQVRREDVYSEAVLTNAGIPFSHEQLVAQAAMDYVVGHVSAPAYGYMKDNGINLAPTPEAILAAQAGICGHAALTFAAIVKRFGLPVRSVQFYYGPDLSWNHISDEVQYGGGWHYFDPTFGIDYEQNGVVLSIADARAADAPQTLLQQNKTLFWTTVVTQANAVELSDVGFATDPATVVEIDQQPFIG